MKLSDDSYFKSFLRAQGIPSDTCFSPELEMRKSNHQEKQKSRCSTKHKRGLQIYAAYLVDEPGCSRKAKPKGFLCERLIIN